MSPTDRRRALRALVEDFLAEFPTLGFEAIDVAEPGEDDVVELLERLLVRHRLQVVDVDELARAAA